MVAITLFISNILKKISIFDAKKFNSNKNSIDYSPNKQYEKTFVPPKFLMYTSLVSSVENFINYTLIFNMEEALLKSCSWFPFFMLVAFEGGGLVRALVLLVLYPLLSLVNEEWKLNIMVFVCFFGVKTSYLRIGKTVLPKFFLEDMGYQGFEVFMRFGKRVVVSNFPRVMVEGFLKEYLGIESVLGRELKVFGGYCLGLMERKEVVFDEVMNNEVSSKEKNVIAVSGSRKIMKDQWLFTNCKDFYLVRKADKENWDYLARDKYPKPLIFHDGRLAFLPNPLASLAMFIWLPFGFLLCITRIIVTIFLPYKISLPILAFVGTSAVVYKHYSLQTNNTSTNQSNNSKGTIYVCNHKTLMDPIYISISYGAHLTALVYSISKLTQIISPIQTIILTRDKENDAKVMQKLLSKESIVVCPEGTTCREPYLLRFSPLFAEMTDDIVPVALEAEVSMFYGTTARGTKALDPIFFLMNPCPFYYINFLAKLPKSYTCGSGGKSKFDVANYVQAEIAKALGYTSTGLTRKDKYMMLAGNVGA